ncbi:uncharacterized protein MONOS_3812 [Monocercomonoides exilis]|uniref:uncharacterized protein n=1 Tax=Monocercomonoides exilis TaxID=2049356 RepID=UPI00355A308E|nr:hypothetical protein MONOS_3812 [Monocercomonoides exilis]|eukprot:MONOS_3812.1-p1 / transcript=MONOS_3812.1 / gene=MONOS_3812 / organism=Monocercomonoides_exilis_PA203 / gene_product=unspecified product / transcript_product=unspecified product / location=Mono_scaffold00093:82471-82854(-) / protein_length=128 / sequence_SO=supercontig / SO=protein_coding / is_pseudo=false
MWEEIVWGGEEVEGEDGRLVGGEGEVCEGEGGMGREEEGAVEEVVVFGEGRWVDGASGGADGGSRVVLGSEEWTSSERDDIEMGHTQGGVDDIQTCLNTCDMIESCISNVLRLPIGDSAFYCFTPGK